MDRVPPSHCVYLCVCACRCTISSSKSHWTALGRKFKLPTMGNPINQRKNLQQKQSDAMRMTAEIKSWRIDLSSALCDSYCTNVFKNFHIDDIRSSSGTFGFVIANENGKMNQISISFDCWKQWRGEVLVYRIMRLWRKYQDFQAA